MITIWGIVYPNCFVSEEIKLPGQIALPCSRIERTIEFEPPRVVRNSLEYHALGGQPLRIINRKIYHQKSETLTGAIHIATNKIFIHLGIYFYPLNDAKKLKKVTEKIMNYFSDFLDILGIKSHSEPTTVTLKRIGRHTGSHSEGEKINIPVPH